MNINYKKSLKLITLLISSLLIATVSAAAYVTLQWTSTGTVVANPKVCFIKWSDGSKQNTFDYAVNIFPSVKTIDENITYGICSWDVSAHTVSMCITSITNQATNIQSITTYVKLSGTTKATLTYTSGDSLPTAEQSFSADPGNYTIWTEITAKSGATGSSVITYQLKVQSP